MCLDYFSGYSLWVKSKYLRIFALFGAIRLVGITMASISYGFALIYKIEDALAPTLNTITLPVSLLSGIILPLALAPIWLQDLAKINPFSYAVNATRELFAGNFMSLGILEGFVIIGVMAFLFSFGD